MFSSEGFLLNSSGKEEFPIRGEATDTNDEIHNLLFLY